MTKGSVITSVQGVTVLGGGSCTEHQLASALAIAPLLVAANGGTVNAQRLGCNPVHVVGDADSLPAEWAPGPPTQHHPITEQDTTDFDKCLRLIAAPVILGVGVLAPRLDHGLASLGTLFKFVDRRIVLVGDGDVCAVIPPRFRMTATPGTRLSIFPFASTLLWSEGLKWELDGLRLSHDGRLGVSNEVADGQFHLRLEQPGCLMIMPSDTLPALVRALDAAPVWPGLAGAG